MRLFRMALTGLVIQCCLAIQVSAAEFGWLKELDRHAQADPSAYRALLATRFGLGDADMQAVFNNVERPSEAYMILRLAELSEQQSYYVIHRYHFNKGWDVLAAKLGINPGSSEFQMLMTGHDLQIRAVTQHAASQHGKL